MQDRSIYIHFQVVTPIPDPHDYIKAKGSCARLAHKTELLAVLLVKAQSHNYEVQGTMILSISGTLEAS